MQAPQPTPIAIAEGSLLHGRYALLRKLGAGAQGQTWLAQDNRQGGQVAVKIVSLRGADSWKTIELWEREVAILRQLSHPAIPAYRDAFQAQSEDGDTLYGLVQDYVEGHSLATRLSEGPPFDQAALVDLARQALQVLSYLHDLQPPVIHRDIKPSNLLHRPDGRLVLIDFGAVQVRVPTGPEGGSTIVGTHGYMPGEQLMGRAVPASDLYALAATLVHLATRRPPADLPTARMRLHFEDVAQLSPALEAWLGKLLEPIAEDRPANAGQALQLLERALRSPALPQPARVQPGPSRPRFGRRFWVITALVALVATLWGIRYSSKLERRLGVSAATAPLRPTESCPFELTGGEAFPGFTFEPVTCQASGGPNGYRSIRLVYRVTNHSDRALKDLYAQVQLLDDDRQVVSGEPQPFPGHLYSIPLEPGESRLIGYTHWQPPAAARAVRYELRGPAKLVAPLSHPPVPLPLERTVPLPAGAALELVQRSWQHTYGSRVTLELRNTGSVALKTLDVEVSFVDREGTVLERKLAHFVDSSVSTLAPGERGVDQVMMAKEAAALRCALVKVVAAP